MEVGACQSWLVRSCFVDSAHCRRLVDKTPKGGGGQNGIALCQLIVGESLIVVSGRIKTIIRKNWREIDKKSWGGSKWNAALSIRRIVDRVGLGVNKMPKGGGQNGRALCRLLVGESLLLWVGESTQFTGKNSTAYPSTTMKDRAWTKVVFTQGDF